MSLREMIEREYKTVLEYAEYFMEKPMEAIPIKDSTILAPSSLGFYDPDGSPEFLGINYLLHSRCEHPGEMITKTVMHEYMHFLYDVYFSHHIPEERVDEADEAFAFWASDLLLGTQTLFEQNAASYAKKHGKEYAMTLKALYSNLTNISNRYGHQIVLDSFPLLIINTNIVSIDLGNKPYDIPNSFTSEAEKEQVLQQYVPEKDIILESGFSEFY